MFKFLRKLLACESFQDRPWPPPPPKERIAYLEDCGAASKAAEARGKLKEKQSMQRYTVGIEVLFKDGSLDVQSLTLAAPDTETLKGTIAQVIQNMAVAGILKFDKPTETFILTPSNKIEKISCKIPMLISADVTDLPGKSLIIP